MSRSEAIPLSSIRREAAAARLLHRQRHLSLSRAVLRGAAFRGGRTARCRLDADRVGGVDLRSMATAMAHDRSRAIPHASADRGARRDPRRHERCVLSGDRPAAARDRRLDRVRRHDRRGARWRAKPQKSCCALLISLIGVYALVGFAGTDDVAGLVLAIANAILFALYIVLGLRLGARAARQRRRPARRGDARRACAASRRWACMMRQWHSSARCCSLLESAWASHLRSSPTSATSWRWHDCRARPLRSCWRCCPRPRRSSARSCSGKFPRSVEMLGIALVAIGIAIHKPG